MLPSFLRIPFIYFSICLLLSTMAPQQAEAKPSKNCKISLALLTVATAMLVIPGIHFAYEEIADFEAIGKVLGQPGSDHYSTKQTNEIFTFQLIGNHLVWFNKDDSLRLPLPGYRTARKIIPTRDALFQLDMNGSLVLHTKQGSSINVVNFRADDIRIVGDQIELVNGGKIFKSNFKTSDSLGIEFRRRQPDFFTVNNTPIPLFNIGD